LLGGKIKVERENRWEDKRTKKKGKKDILKTQISTQYNWLKK
jgi:hypothetical protein